MIKFFIIILAIIIAIMLQILDDFLSQRGVVSVLHGGILGYGQIYFARELLEWGGLSLGWFVVIFVVFVSMAVSYFKIMNTWTRWVCAFNFGIVIGNIYGGLDLI